MEPMASVAPPLRMNELAIRVDPILPNKPDIEVMRRSELSDVVDPKMFEIDGPTFLVASDHRTKVKS